MKNTGKLNIIVIALSCILLSACGTLGSSVSSIIGLDKPAEQQLYGTWNYQQPSVAFTSKNLLAKAGGEVAATQIKNKLKPQYQYVGFNSVNTAFTLNPDKTFSAKFLGRTIGGTYEYEPTTCKLTFHFILLNLPCYVKRTAKGMAFLLESKKLLSLFRTAAIISGNDEMKIVGELSKNYEGIRIGFDMAK